MSSNNTHIEVFLLTASLLDLGGTPPKFLQSSGHDPIIKLLNYNIFSYCKLYFL